jgi:hypothetical protein
MTIYLTTIFVISWWSVFSPFLIHDLSLGLSGFVTGATSGAGTAYPSRATPVFSEVHVARSLVF